MPSVTFDGFSVEELKAAFDAVCNKEDWRAPIDAEVSKGSLEITVSAITFYAATPTRVSNTNNGFKIESIGYRDGPAGP